MTCLLTDCMRKDDGAVLVCFILFGRNLRAQGEGWSLPNLLITVTFKPDLKAYFHMTWAHVPKHKI